MRFIFLFSYLFCCSFAAFSDRAEDSLRHIIKNDPSDEAKIMAYTTLVGKYRNEPAKALEILSEMNVFCERKLKSTKSKALCLRKLGVQYGNLNFFDKALEYTFKSADLFQKLNDKEGLANCFNNIGSFYNNKGEFTKDKLFYKRSIEYHLKAIEIRTEINDTSQIRNSYNNIGNTYMSIEDYQKALEYFNKAFEIYTRSGDRGSIEMITMNLGDCYLNIGLKENNKTYLKQALFYFLSVLKNYKEDNPSDRYSGSLTRVGEIYSEMGNTSLGISYLQKGIAISQKIKDKNAIMISALELSKAYEKTGDYQKALEFNHLYNSTKDSLLNEKTGNNIEQMQTIYQTAQKDKEIDKLNNEKIIKDAELSRQRTIIFSTVGTVLFVLILVLVLWSRYNLKKKANLELGDAYKKIELKNKQITDSINYSKRIQNAILPPADLVSKHLKNFFVYYSPKDIVSGDFYWFSDHHNRSFFIVVDCTGHGVPGALMSMIGNTLLNEIINQKNISEPGEILNHLNKGVKNALRQAGADMVSQDDGMDVSICMIDNKEPNQLHYACANHSIFIKANKKVIELTGDIYSIGGDFGTAVKNFESKMYSLEPGSFVVMSTDGYYDQFGGESDSKFLITRFEDLILHSDLSRSDTAEEFNKVLLSWKGMQKQTDDILVAGFRV